jgi:hypothetical protein
VSLGKRLLDLARANVNALLDRAGAAHLEEFSDEELQAELELRQARRQREDEVRSGREAAERAARERAGARQRAQPKPPPAGSARRKEPRDPGLTDEQRRLAKLYAQLETAYGADLETVKRNYRALLRRHHPDLNGGTPEAQRAATEKTKTLTAAYNELEQLLSRR